MGNSRGKINFTEERLNRVLSNQNWIIFFPKADVANIPILTSDHLVLVLRITDVPRLKKKGFSVRKFMEI